MCARAVLARVQVDPHRQALFGHSLGGLFVLYMMFTRPQCFDTYVAASPSIWWSDKEIMRELPGFEAALARKQVRPRLLIAVGGLEDRTNPEELRLIGKLGMTGARDMARIADMVGNAQRLAAQLQELRGLDTVFVEFPDETHNSLIPAYFGRGARFTMSQWYR